MKHFTGYSKSFGLQLFPAQESIGPIPPEARADLRTFLAQRWTYTDSWFFLLRVLLGLGIFGYLAFGAFVEQNGVTLGLVVAGIYVLCNIVIHLMSNHGFPYARWGYMILDFLAALVLRYLFEFDALLDPHATMIGIFSLLLIAYVQYNDIHLGSVLALVTILFTVLTFWITLLSLLPVDLHLFSNLPYQSQYPRPLQALMLLASLAAVCIMTHRLVHRLYNQLLRYSVEQSKRTKASAATAIERSRREHLEKLNQVKKDFITVISHELRNPITPLLSSLDILDNELNEGARSNEMLGIARESAARIQRIVIDYTKLAELITLDDESLLRWNVRLNDLLLVLQEQTDKQPCIMGNIDDLVVCTDPRLFGGALLALMRRAEIHTSVGDTITVRGYNDNGEVVKSIHDPSSFLEEQTIASLDDPFALSDERAFSTQPNTGLELILAHYSLQRLGGSLQIESSPNDGTTVHCTVPGQQADTRWLSDAQLRQELRAVGM